MEVSDYLHGHVAIQLWKEHSLFTEWGLGGPHDQSGCFGESKILQFK